MDRIVERYGLLHEKLQDLTYNKFKVLKDLDKEVVHFISCIYKDGVVILAQERRDSIMSMPMSKAQLMELGDACYELAKLYDDKEIFGE